MTAATILAFALLATFTSFVAGIFGMAGGMLLMGGLLLMVSVPDAMILHGITQMSSNGWRAVLWRRYILWSIVIRYIAGLMAAGALFLSLALVPDDRIVMIMLGVVPFLGRMIPADLLPQANKRGGAELCGLISTSLQLLSGVSGPMLDMFFVRSLLDRRQVVATKAACQVVTHFAKLIYFGSVIGGASNTIGNPIIIAVAVSMAIFGTTMGRSILERLSDNDFRKYTWLLVQGIGGIYLVRGISGYF
jgi:uncharacterized membrane protein YfcA